MWLNWFLWRLKILLGRWTLRSADVFNATNESSRSAAIERGGMSPDRAFVVRTVPNLTRVRILPPGFGQRRVREVLAREHEGKKLLAAYEAAFAGLDCARNCG